MALYLMLVKVSSPQVASSPLFENPKESNNFTFVNKWDGIVAHWSSIIVIQLLKARFS